MKPAMLWMFVGIAGAIAASGWGAHEYLHGTFAGKESLQLAGGKVEYLLDQRMASLRSRIGFLEGKSVKTRDDRDRLNYLRQEVETLRKIKAGK